jgi:hypothetical protein
MATNYFTAMQRLGSITAEHSSEALQIADARSGQRFDQGFDSALLEIIFSVPDDEFNYFRLLLRRKAQKYELNSRISQSYRNLALALHSYSY